MKKLFVVKKDGRVVSGDLLNKMDAKRTRDELGGIAEGFHVSRGVDNLPSPTGVPRMRRQPKR